MGCHTWFYVPFLSDKEEIIKAAKEYLVKNKKYLTDDYMKMYEGAINNEIEEVISDLASELLNCSREFPWELYMGIEDYSLLVYNQTHGTSYTRFGDDYAKIQELEKEGHVESYSDEPRIGGYPENQIKSFDEMIAFMKEGFTDDKGKHFDFYYDEDRIEKVMENIKTFFEKHPKGLITFG